MNSPWNYFFITLGVLFFFYFLKVLIKTLKKK